MRSGLVAAVLVAACGGRAPAPAVPRAPVEAPAADLGAAKRVAPRVVDPGHAETKDPRVVDLDIVRITAHETSPGGDRATEQVATADLFRDAGEAAKSGETERAISIYRRIVADFPESKYAPISLFDIAAIYDGRRDLPATISTLRELVTAYPASRESVDGHLFIAALQTDHDEYADALATLTDVLARDNLTYADRIEAFARRGYCELQLHHYDDADAAFASAIAAWQQVPHLDDPYYIAMAYYYRGEVAHRRFLEAPVRLPDDQLIADLDAKRVLAVTAYDLWKQSLGFRQAYWATASGYQMSQIFVELWEVTVKAPYPAKIAEPTRRQYIEDVHDRVREHLAKALEGHRMNVELAKAFGVETSWSKGSETRAAQVSALLADDAAGHYVTPDSAGPIDATR
ncbi:MAG TPA: tetratricopeptide repeat protein [Kofleriaceae bacterium]|jgi:tetratricopeptide (TPR) repeat protein